MGCGTGSGKRGGGEHLAFTARLVLSLRPAPGRRSACLVAHAGGKTGGRKGDFDIVISEREVGQKHFFLGPETSINIRCRGSTLLVCKGESFGGNM